jgi:hypothetical protein
MTVMMREILKARNPPSHEDISTLLPRIEIDDSSAVINAYGSMIREGFVVQG